MTYADVITLLLCLFAVSLALSMPKKNLPPQAEVHTRVIPDCRRDSRPVRRIILRGNLPLHGFAAGDRPHGKSCRSNPHPPADASPATLPEIVDHLKTQGGNIEQKGDRITTIQVSSTAFFGSGQATLEQGKTILQAVAVNLKSDQFKDYQITVEGHTDDSPTTQFHNNWELSTARAAAVVQFFLQQRQIPAQRLRAAELMPIRFPFFPTATPRAKQSLKTSAKPPRRHIKLGKIERRGE